MRTLAVGDVHGHLHRLEALLKEAGAGDDDTVVQLGDLGHVGRQTQHDDVLAWRAAQEGLVDIVLWGNHDRALVDRRHMFGGYGDPSPELRKIVNDMERDGRVKLAHAAHGWLLTHAGLHPDFGDVGDAERLAQWLNDNPGSRAVNAVGRYRGGDSPAGGILWRDVEEDLDTRVPQVFGHSASRQHVVRGEADEWYCVDIGGAPGTREAECLAGIWLPSQELVQVRL